MAKPLKEQDTPNSVAAEVIMRNLPKVPGPKKYQSKGTINIWCPFHGDPNERMVGNPSFMLNLAAGERFPVGFGHCFSCGKTKNWNDIAAKYGLEKYGEGDDADIWAVKPDFDKLSDRMFAEDDGESLDHLCPQMRIPFHLGWQKGIKWRGIKSKTLISIGAHYGLDEETEDQAVILPVNVQGDLVGAVKARWKPQDGSPSYINSPGKWTKRKGLFLLDESLEIGDGSTIILGEGPRDALRLYQDGLPGVSILGVTNWTKAKRDLLMEAGVETIILCMDGDKAGNDALKKIKPDLIGYFDVYVFNLNKWRKRLKLDKIDPGNAPKIVMDRLHKMYERVSGDSDEDE